ncbi:GNAT family N-acetyltransferase [Yeosuana sp.]|uniref:GNAT family N-acetyltransferase n=1 Tax=Yeosuana sp. TaxID=2529388 RepID=UPI004054A6E7
MIERQEWDSNFFGYQIGKLALNNPDNFNFEVFEKKSNPYKLVYVFSSKKLKFEHLHLVDTKVTFLKEIEYLEDHNTSNIVLFNKNEDDFKVLEELALSSGEYSRFKIDKNFINGEYEVLYKEWIRKSVDKETFLDIIVYKENKHILGFTTLEGKGQSISNIGLVAVNQKERGKKIGTKLINFTVNHAFIKGFKEIQVITQQDNSPAMSLYEKCGFIISKTEYIYHYWNL